MNEQKIVSLRTVAVEVNDAVVEMLAETLERAQAGEIQSIVIAATMTGGRTLTDFVTDDRVEAIGLSGLLHHTLCAKQRDCILEGDE